MLKKTMAVLLASTSLTPAVWAQDAPSQTDPDDNSAQVQGGITQYEPDYFSQFNPLTAWDMVQRVPGFDAETGDGPGGGDGVRGFGGTAGNVLIDGERPSSKQGLRDILQRIPVSQVERIELVRGSVAGFDMRGQTEVVNVVRKEGVAGSGSYLTHIKYNEKQPVTLLAQASYSGRWGPWNLSGNLFRDTDWRGEDGPEFLRSPDGNLIQRREEADEQHYRTWEGGFEADAQFGATSVRLNGQAQFALFDFKEVSFAFDGSDQFEQLVLSDSDDEWVDYEFGGDIERQINDNWAAKLIFLNAKRDSESNQVFDRFNNFGFDETIRQTSNRETGETIGRGFVTYTPTPNHSFEFGVERAFNYLDSDVQLTRNGGAGTEVIDVPVSNTRVEETRNEVFASWTWRAQDNLTIEPGLIYEFSEISQSGQGANSRELDFLKPNVSLSWQIDPNQQFSLTLERLVSQLNFDDFASSTDVNDDQVNLGNPDLEPDRTWNLEASWNRRFWEDGSITFTGKYEKIEELLDLLPVTTTDGRTFAAPGNIGDAWRTQFGVEFSLPTDRFGIPGGLIEGQFTKQDSEVDDPITGEARKIRGDSDYWWGLDFRQDFTQAQFSWGVDIFDRGQRSVYRLDEIRNNENTAPRVEVYAETTRFFGVTTRIQVENIADRRDRRERIFYDAPRDIGMIDAIERREKGSGLFYRFIIRGTF